MTGRALRDSVRIATKFSEMEKNYSSLNSLRFKLAFSSIIFIVLYCNFYLSIFCHGLVILSLSMFLDLHAIIWILVADLTCAPVMMCLLMLRLKSNGILKMDTRI